MAKKSYGVLEKEDKRPLNSKSFKELAGIYKYILPYKYTFLLGMMCLVVSSVTVLAFPFVTGQMVDAALGKSTGWFKDINTIALALLGVFIVQALFSFLRVYLFSQVSERSMADIRTDLYKKMMGLPIPFYDSRRTGELMSRISSDVTLLQDTLSISLAEFFRQTVTLIAGVVIIMVHSPKLSLFMLAIFPFLVVAAMIFGRFIRKLSKKTQDQLAEANTVVEETLQSVHVVKSFTNEAFEILRYQTILQKVVKTALRTATFRGAFVSFIILAIFGGIVLVMWYGAGLVSKGMMSIGDLFSFILYTSFIGASVGGLGEVYSQLQRAIGASERIREILDTPSETEIGSSPVAKLPIYGKIAFNDIQFSYPTRVDVPVLKGISFEVNAGEKVALVGHSGAGKSTIVQLLMRFYAPDKGEIKVDGQNINQFDLIPFRKNVGIVPQEVMLFGGTIGENIAYGKPGASEEEIIMAAKKANAYQFIQTFPEGLKTLVGERGIKLSGGQRQRIAIARAILKDPAILILDEATSSLDAESEKLVQEALEELMKGRTSIVIAHRLATIRKVDKIYVIDAGQITESGTHDELANLEQGIYSKLIKLQFEK